MTNNKKLWILAFIIIPVLGILLTITNNFFKDKAITKNTVNNMNSPNSINTINQKGNNAIINNTDLPEPTFQLETFFKNIPNNNNFKSEFKLKVRTKIPVNRLFLKAEAISIMNMDILPQRGTDMHFSAHKGKRLPEGYVFETLKNVYGDYIIRVTTSKPEEVKFILSYN
ncbi:hypothetical protein ACFLZV_04740 [Candidatus Margulisiibacteriota bacterium]